MDMGTLTFASKKLVTTRGVSQCLNLSHVCYGRDKVTA